MKRMVVRVETIPDHGFKKTNPACPIHLIGYTAKTVRIRTKGQG
jgi:hypothetical protein